VIATKAGGLTCSESLAMQTPMVVFRPTPGQEEKNSLALSVAGAAVRARTFEQVGSSIERILAHPALQASMREACRQLARPRAAFDVARQVLGLPADPALPAEADAAATFVPAPRAG
jgi:processive 1,2-diacylglycerol beta-glucosyltransferase